METLFIFVLVQIVIGAFDLVYHHEWLERLPWRTSAATELKLHGIRNFFYALMFFSLGWLEWHGLWAWGFATILLIEVLITLWDFVEEDNSRTLPATERVSHTILALNYGIILALFAPYWTSWSNAPTAVVWVEYGLYSWMMLLCTAGVFFWGVRDLASGIRLSKKREVFPDYPMLGDSPQSILITGATGFIGRRLTQAIIHQGHKVTVLTRTPDKAAALFKGRYTVIDAWASLTPSDYFDGIINLAGEPVSQRWTKASKAKMVHSRLDMLGAISRWIESAERKPKVLITASAIGIYGTSESLEFTEESLASDDPQGLFPRQVCEQIEQVADGIKQQGVRVCVMRIGVVLEQEGGALSPLLFPFDFCLGGVIGSGKQWFSWIHRDDVIGLIIHAINHDHVFDVINAVAPQPVRNKEFVKALAKAMKRVAFIPLPAFVVKLLLGEMGQVLLLAGQKVVPAKAQASGYQFKYPSIDAALSAIFKV